MRSNSIGRLRQSTRAKRSPPDRGVAAASARRFSLSAGALVFVGSRALHGAVERSGEALGAAETARE